MLEGNGVYYDSQNPAMNAFEDFSEKSRKDRNFAYMLLFVVAALVAFILYAKATYRDESDRSYLSRRYHHDLETNQLSSAQSWRPSNCTPGISFCILDTPFCLRAPLRARYGSLWRHSFEEDLEGHFQVWNGAPGVGAGTKGKSKDNRKSFPSPSRRSGSGRAITARGNCKTRRLC
jgi:hypothetical protein